MTDRQTDIRKRQLVTLPHGQNRVNLKIRRDYHLTIDKSLSISWLSSSQFLSIKLADLVRLFETSCRHFVHSNSNILWIVIGQYGAYWIKCQRLPRKTENGPISKIGTLWKPPLKMEILKIRFFHVRKGPNIGTEPKFHDPTTSNVRDYPRKPKMG